VSLAGLLRAASKLGADLAWRDVLKDAADELDCSARCADELRAILGARPGEGAIDATRRVVAVVEHLVDSCEVRDRDIEELRSLVANETRETLRSGFHKALAERYLAERDRLAARVAELDPLCRTCGKRVRDPEAWPCPSAQHVICDAYGAVVVDLRDDQRPADLAEGGGE